MISREEITRLRNLERLATTGPWETHQRQGRHVIESPAALVATVPFGDAEAADDAAFIAAMRNALPRLLDEIEQLRATAGMSEKE